MTRLVSALAALALLGCGGEAVRPDVVLVVIDTLRADRLGVYGNERELTPFLDSFAARSTVFSDAHAPSSWTRASMASIFTSRDQPDHGVTGYDSVLSSGQLTLAEALAQKGYRTAGFTANPVAAAKWGFGQGFDTYQTLTWRAPNETEIGARAAQVNDAALAWLRGLGRGRRTPRFVHLHYMEPHPPYAPEAFAVERFFPGVDRDLLWLRPRYLLKVGKLAEPETLRALLDGYAAAIASLDRSLEELFGRLEESGFLEDAVVAITADHGEEFLEHGQAGHGHTLYDELLRVPLLLRLPGQTERYDVTEPVSLIDLAPTLLDLASGDVPEAFRGRSLRARLERSGGREPGPDRAIFSDLYGPDEEYRRHERAVILGPHKMITWSDGRREFFDRARDPGEKAPEALSPAERARLEALAGSASAEAVPTESRPLDAADREMLRALGYLE